MEAEVILARINILLGMLVIGYVLFKKLQQLKADKIIVAAIEENPVIKVEDNYRHHLEQCRLADPVLLEPVSNYQINVYRINLPKHQGLIGYINGSSGKKLSQWMKEGKKIQSKIIAIRQDEIMIDLKIAVQVSAPGNKL
jgi:nucleoid-associated protein YejK